MLSSPVPPSSEELFAQADVKEWHEVADIAGHVFSFLDIEDLCSVAQLSRALNRVEKESPELWERLLVVNYGTMSTEGGGSSSPRDLTTTLGGQEPSSSSSCSSSAKVAVRKQWRAPRAPVLNMIWQLKNARTLDEYFEAERHREQYGRLAEDVKLGAVFQRAALMHSITGNRVTTQHQISLVGSLATAAIVLKCLPLHPTTGQQEGGGSSLWWGGPTLLSPADVLGPTMTNALLSLPMNLYKSKWAPWLLGGTILGSLIQRNWKKVVGPWLPRTPPLEKSSIRKHREAEMARKGQTLDEYVEEQKKKETKGKFKAPKSLPLSERVKIVINFALKSVADNLLTFQIIPYGINLALLAGSVYSFFIDQPLSGGMPWLLNSAIYFGVVSLLFASMWFIFVGIILILLYIVAQTGAFPPIWMLTTRVNTMLLWTVSVVMLMGKILPAIHDFSKVKENRYERTGDGRRAQRFVSRLSIRRDGNYSAVLAGLLLTGNLGILLGSGGNGWLQFFLAKLGNFLTWSPPSSALSSIDHQTGILALSAIFARFAISRPATSLYGGHFMANPILAVIFDMAMVRCFQDEGLAVTLVLRATCAALFVILGSG